MSKKQVHGAKKSTRRKELESYGFLGIHLGGAKSDRTAYAYVEYFPDQKKNFLNHVQTRIKADGDISSDLLLYEEIIARKSKIKFLAYNVALSLPKCMTCKLKCPGYEMCDEEEILWMWDNYRKNIEPRKNKKIFTPYTERCVEHYILASTDEKMQVQSALGANMAPLTARAHYINRRLKMPSIEVFPQLSVSRICAAIGVSKNSIQSYKHPVHGEGARQTILKNLIDRKVSFFYEQDLRLLSANVESFEAYFSALTAVLKFKNQCEKRPKDFPRKEGWIEIPNESIVW